MLTFAFDAGGDEKTPYLTVAGFVSDLKHWDDFSQLWGKRLAVDGIEFFHATDMDGFYGPYKHLKDRIDRKNVLKALSGDLMELIKRNTYRRFACTVVNKHFREMSESMREEFALSAYSLAGRTCAKYMRIYLQENYQRDVPFAMIFESGDKGKGKLEKRLYEDMGISNVLFRGKRDRVDEDGLMQYGFIPLQAADWLAHEVNLATKKIFDSNFEIASESEFRWPMQQFIAGPPGFMTIYDGENFQEMEKQLELLREIKQWEQAIGVSKMKSSRKSA